MKKKTLVNIMFAAFALSALPGFGQTDKGEWRLAVDVLKGKDTSRDKAWAVNLLEESQSTEPDAFVQNVLGIAYLHGLGTEADTAKAVMYFQQSGTLGYPLAYHNLGMYHKYAANGKQDFKKAYEAFDKGAEKGDPSCCYNTGFMKYKGLGCEQNYTEAVELFQRAADFNHTYAMFMLGLCYRNGYGVDADSTIGNAYLRQAADLGNADAMEELLSEEPENHGTRYFAEFDNNVDVPEEMPTIVPYLPVDNRAVAGKYDGLLVTYDWSGHYVISEKPLSADLSVVRDSVTGIWIQGNDTVCFTAKIAEDNSFRFNDVEMNLYDRYSSGFYSRYRFEKVDVNYCKGFITGQLRLYSLDEQEPDRPMYVCLRKDAATMAAGSDDVYEKIRAYSDPYSNRVTLKFELGEAVPSVKVGIYSRMGINLCNYSFGQMEAGVNTLIINPDLEEGYYAAYIWAGTSKYQTINVK